ncbi:Histidine phosphatase superfamily (branch 1) [Reichenbachiella faecimaris]|uniref:Histidine phosphatase superfamily (Branch 1) n=1 Tax=Reichenbachiella faecimaris TaxID=692418 RepID=A0A1W2GNN4_REIFA|nr:phosphoglycerate mutase family protein [Reichenbachiella faecimaris]SMD38265.1 Histidine phosphatase superfamily (branch 1) [Reichenbachiella faecimaris]
MKNILIAIIAILCFQCSSKQPCEEDFFTIYLVRHAEKDTIGSSNDPALTSCGQERSEQLADLLEAVALDAIYSSDYIRTKDTAKPIAQAKNLEIQLYNSGELADFSELLLKRKEDAFVVGHSNTTGVLAGLLVGKELEAFDESIYNRIYQVVFGNKKGKLHLLHSSFSCE